MSRTTIDGLIALGLAAMNGDAPTITAKGRKVLIRGSSLLLQASGVKNRMLGKGFRAHPGAPVFGVYDEPVDMSVGATQGWASTAFR